MLGFLGSIFSPIISGVTKIFVGDQEIEKVKLAGKIAVLTAEANSKVAISEAKIQMAKNGQANNFDLDRIAMQNMEKSYKDEFILIMFSVPMIMSFFPKTSEYALRGFEVIEKMPDWYQYTFIGMIVVIYGMRGMLTKFLDGKALVNSVKPATKVAPAGK